MRHRIMLAFAVAILAGPSLAATVTAQVSLATPAGPGAVVGKVAFEDTMAGAKISVDLHGLPPGEHGFHIHANPSCDAGPVNGAVAPAGAAGGHYDPAMTKMHMGPDGAGHLGDLPFLTVGADGSDTQTLTAPHIKDVTQLSGHSVLIHAGGDNYSDQPKPLGGGGARIACGVMR